MNRILPALVAILSLAASPALAQTAPVPGSMGGDQVGTGAVVVQGNSGAGSSAAASTAITSTPVTGSAATGSAAGASAATGGSGASGGGSGGGRGGGMEALCLSANGSVTSVDPDEFGLSCPQ